MPASTSAITRSDSSRERVVLTMASSRRSAEPRSLDDVLWCDDRDTHAVYGTVLLLQPYVEKDFLSNLRETCELNGDIIKPGKPQNDDRRRTL